MAQSLLQKRSTGAAVGPSRIPCRSQIHPNRAFGNARHRQTLFGARQRKGVVANGLFGLGLPEVAVVAGIAVLVFGPSKLPELGKELGKTVKSFQTAAKEFETELKNATDETSDKIDEKAEDLKDNIRK